MSGVMNWHGYEQHPDAHPERPWWRKVRGHDAKHFHWERTDGDCITLDGGSCTPWATPDGGEFSDIDDAMQDWDFNRTAPDPRCGQVWLWLEEQPYIEAGYQGLLTQVETDTHGWAATVGCLTMSGGEWPPAGAVLVAGPGSPWAPMGEDAP